MLIVRRPPWHRLLLLMPHLLLRFSLSLAPSPEPKTPDQHSLAKEVATELSNEEEVLVAAADEEEELYKELFILTQSIPDPEIEKVNEKLERLKTVMAKKSSLQKTKC